MAQPPNSAQKVKGADIRLLLRGEDTGQAFPFHSDPVTQIETKLKRFYLNSHAPGDDDDEDTSPTTFLTPTTTTTTTTTQEKTTVGSSRKRTAATAVHDGVKYTSFFPLAAAQAAAQAQAQQYGHEDGSNKRRKTSTTSTTDANVVRSGVLFPSPLATPRNAPSIVLHAFGSNDNGELGLGAESGVEDVLVPTPNPFFEKGRGKVMAVAAGGMHCVVVLAFDTSSPTSTTGTNNSTINGGNTGMGSGSGSGSGSRRGSGRVTRSSGRHQYQREREEEKVRHKVLTWGVNDNGALGRDTSVREDDMDTDLDLNPKEARPGEVTFFEGVGDGKGGGNGGQKKEIRVRDIAAGDSATWVVTEDRGVWGWGTMRSSEGTTRFHPLTTLQSFPTPISSIPEPIIRIVAGCNHVLCLSQKGNVYTWGAGCEQGQLGRRVVERSRLSHVLTPRKIGLKSIADIGTGSDHSFAISSDGKVYAWGLNNFGQTGVVPSSKRNTIGGTKAGEDSACVMLPSLVEGLAGKKVVKITGGNKHSLALTETGEVYSWGMVDGFATGHRLADFTEGDERVVRDERGRPRILKVPTKIRGALEGKKVISVTAGGEHSLVVTSEGKAYGWGFNNSHQTGQRGDDDVEVPMLVDYKAVRGKRFVWAGAGGQFSLLGEEVLD